MPFKNVQNITIDIIHRFFFCRKENDRWGVTTPGWPLMLGCGFLKAGFVGCPRSPKYQGVGVSHQGLHLMRSSARFSGGKRQFPDGQHDKKLCNHLTTASLWLRLLIGRPFLSHSGRTFLKISLFSALQTTINFPAESKTWKLPQTAFWLGACLSMVTLFVKRHLMVSSPFQSTCLEKTGKEDNAGDCWVGTPGFWWPVFKNAGVQIPWCCYVWMGN